MPADSGRIVLSSRIMEDDLRSRGHVEARARTIVYPVAEDDPFELGIRFEVDPERNFVWPTFATTASVLRTDRWVERTAGLEPGGRSALRRRRRGPPPALPDRRVPSASTFTTSEDGTGGRNGVRPWPSISRNLGDTSCPMAGAMRATAAPPASWTFIDTNSLGRGQTSGVRLIYGEEKKRLRLYHMIPRIVGQRSTLELFVEGRDDVEEVANVEGIEAWAQLTFPVAGHLMRTYAVFETRDVVPFDPSVPGDDLVLSPRLGWQAIFSGIDQTASVEQRKGTFVGLDLSGSSYIAGRRRLVGGGLFPSSSGFFRFVEWRGRNRGASGCRRRSTRRSRSWTACGWAARSPSGAIRPTRSDRSMLTASRWAARCCS